MLFSFIKKYINSLLQLMRTIFESFLLLMLLYYGYSFYSWLKTPTPYETSNLVRRFVGYPDSVSSNEIAQYQGSARVRTSLEFSRIQEEKFSAVGYGVDVKEWDNYVDELQRIYKLSPEVANLLKLAKYGEYSQILPSDNFYFDESNGDAKYFRLMVEHKNGKINFAFAGNKVNFRIAPIREVLKHTTTVLWVFTWTDEKVHFQPRYLTMDEKSELETYFIGRAVDHFVSQYSRQALNYEREYNSRGNSDNWDTSLKQIQKLF